MKNLIHTTTANLLALVLICAVQSAKAQVIVEDHFNQASSGGITSLAGQAPNTNVPGHTWTTLGSGFTAENASNGFLGSYSLAGAPGSPVPYAFVNGDSASLNITGSNSGTLTLSAYMNNQAGGDGSLGFSNVATGAAGYVFDGFNIDNSGAVTRTINGTTTSAIAFGGTYDASSLSLLSFTINTTTGAVTGISFQGSTADYSGLLGGSAFTASATDHVALRGSTATRYADLTLSSAQPVPEPSTWAMLIAGLALLLGVSRLRRKTALP